MRQDTVILALDDIYNGALNVIIREDKGLSEGELTINFKTLSLSAEDAHVIEARNYQVAETLRAFKVPPHLFRDVGRE